jgi:hypothetical protein
MAGRDHALVVPHFASLDRTSFGGQIMRMRFSPTAILLAASVTAAAADSRAQTPVVVAGRILSVNCDARLNKNGAKADVTLLSPRDIGLGLSEGDRVQCLGTGDMEVLVSDGTQKINVPRKWFLIPPLPVNSSYPKEDTAIADALKNYGVSGATRGNAADSRILWPSENSAVVPEHFVVRWAPVPQKIELSILSEAKDVTLWGPAEVDGSAGSLKSDAVSSALAAYKTKPGSPGLILTLTLANTSDWEEVHFSLLNARQEQELDAQLDFWEKHTEDLALRLGRGYSFTRHKLFAEAAEEYDSALMSAPESRYLLEDAIQANRLAGRASRVKELQTRLVSLPQAPSQ